MPKGDGVDTICSAHVEAAPNHQVYKPTVTRENKSLFHYIVTLYPLDFLTLVSCPNLYEAISANV